MALTSYQFRNQPYGLGFVFAGQAFTVSYRAVIPGGRTLFIQISTGENTITHITNMTIISQSGQLGIKLIKSPHFMPGNKKIPVVNLDDRSKIQAATSFYSDASDVYGGTIMEESMIPQFAFSQGGSLIESTLFERILQYGTDYILAITNESFYPTGIAVSMAFYESGN
ncbi:MAG: hypothetical protein ACM3KR_03280 [Deltaproteobacteria bacterium]